MWCKLILGFIYRTKVLIILQILNFNRPVQFLLTSQHVVSSQCPGSRYCTLNGSRIFAGHPLEMYREIFNSLSAVEKLIINCLRNREKYITHT